MLRIDEARVRQVLAERKPRAAVVNAPDGLLAQAQDLAQRMSLEYGIPVFVFADPSYGSCDTVSDADVARVGADLAFHIGHTNALNHLPGRTIFVDAADDVSFQEVLERTLPRLGNARRVGLVTISQHLPALPASAEFLRSFGFDVVIGAGKGQLQAGQVFGCEFYPAYRIRDDVDIFVFLGASLFHAVGVALATSRTTLMLDPYQNTVTDVTQLAEERRKRAILTVYKARDARRFGMILDLKEGQLNLPETLRLAGRVRNYGREVDLIAMREITNERIMQMSGIEAFIQTGCPRVGLDGYAFQKPVLSVPQAEALMAIWEGRDPGPFLERPHWL